MSQQSLKKRSGISRPARRLPQKSRREESPAAGRLAPLIQRGASLGKGRKPGGGERGPVIRRMALLAALATAVLAGGCLDALERDNGGSGQGGIIARVEGIGTGGSESGAATNGAHIALPAGLVAFRAIVSGPGIEPALQADFDATATEGRIEQVPAGNDRTLTVQALDEAERVPFQGQVTGITIIAGRVFDAGTITLGIALPLNWDQGRWDQANWQ